MERVLNVFKPVGATPLQLIKKFQYVNPQYKDKKIAYAGRLDPMAEGVLVLLIEPENRKAPRYQRLDKEYVFDVLLGVGTDSFDVLGIVKNTNRPAGFPGNDKLKKILNSFAGKYEQEYPPFSSKPVKGKPLYWWARGGKLNEIEIPSKEVEVYSIELLGTYSIKKEQLRRKVTRVIGLVEGNFRQEKILDSWESFFKKSRKGKFRIAKVKIACSSGCYVRSIANKIGKRFGTDSVAYSILRTSVGDYKLKDSIRLNE